MDAKYKGFTVSFSAFLLVLDNYLLCQSIGLR